MNIIKGDNVEMLNGKDRGKSGKVITVLNIGSVKKVVVTGLNMIKKHQRPKKQGTKGQIISVERAVDISNVQLLCPKCGKKTRILRKIIGENKIRICRKCNSEI